MGKGEERRTLIKGQFIIDDFMDFFYHGFCLDGAFCVSLFVMAYQILRHEKQLSKTDIRSLFSKEGLPHIAEQDDPPDEQSSGRLKKEAFFEFPDLDSESEEVRFREVKLTCYNRVFEELLIECK